MTQRKTDNYLIQLMVVVLLTSVLILDVAAQRGDFDIVIANGRVIDPESKLDAVRYIGIKGKQVIVSSSEVAKPVAVRYAWAKYPTVNFYNKEGLPANPFRTDDWPMVTASK